MWADGRHWVLAFFWHLLAFARMFSASPGARSPIYAQVDEQIQKYIGLKSAISLVAAVLVLVVFVLLQVRVVWPELMG